MALLLNIKLMTFWRNSSHALAGRRTASKSDKDSSLHSASLRSVQNDRRDINSRMIFSPLLQNVQLNSNTP